MFTHDIMFTLGERLLKPKTNNDMLCLYGLLGTHSFGAIVLLYCTWRYYTVRAVPCMTARRPRLTVLFALTLVLLFITHVLYYLDAIYHHVLFRLSFVILNPVITHSGLYICAIKYWLLYYDTQFILSSEDNQWKTHINPNNVTSSNNWYVRNIRTVGNEYFLLRHVAWMVVIPSIVVSTLTLFTPTHGWSSFIHLFFIAIPFTSILIFWCKTPPYLDYFRVREECRFLLFMGVLIFVVLSLTLALIVAFRVSPHNLFVLIVCTQYLFAVGLFTIGLHITLWTLLKNQHRINMNEKASDIYLCYRRLIRKPDTQNPNLSVQRQLEQHKLSPVQTNMNVIDAEQAETLPLLVRILENEHGWTVFVSHLLAEFCLETALCIIEFTQYQQLMKELFAANEDDREVNPFAVHEVKVLNLPDLIPRSVIVFDPEKDGHYEIADIAKKLLQKYIKVDSPFEINISYKLKKKLSNDLESIERLDQKDLIHIFDECIHSLLLLLNDSLKRFMQTPKYKQIEKELLVELEMEMEATLSVPTLNANGRHSQNVTPDKIVISKVGSGPGHYEQMSTPKSPITPASTQERVRKHSPNYHE